MSSPTADVSVRIAWADDADAIAELQLRTWQQVYADLGACRGPAHARRTLPRCGGRPW